MLDVMRENMKHLKWVLWIVVVSLVAYLGLYFTDHDAGVDDSQWAARVDGEPISVLRFNQEARREEDRYRQIFGSQYEQVRNQLQLGRQVLQRLVDQDLILRQASGLGLDATPEELRQEILSNPAFRDNNGQFVGRERYERMVARATIGGVAEYEQALANQIVIQKWIALVSQPVEVSDDEVEEAWKSRNIRGAVDYVVVPSAEQDTPVSVSEAELAAWYEGHKDVYRRGEARKVRMLVVERQAQLSKVKVADEDVRSYYDTNRTEFDLPEQRRARHILIRLEPGAGGPEKDAKRKLAESILERAKKGEDFAALARANSQDPGSAEKGGDLGYFGKGQMVPPFEAAAFQTPVGELAPLIETNFGFHVLQVMDSRPAGVVPFEEVSDSIRRSVEQRRAQEVLRTEAERLRREIQSATDLERIAAKESLKVEERVIVKDERLGDIGPSPEFMDAVFRLETGAVSAPLGVARGLAILSVVEALPPDVRPLIEVRDRVKADVLNERARDAAMTGGRRALLQAGGDLVKASKILGKEVKNSGEIGPGSTLPGTGGGSPELDRALFGGTGAVGGTGVSSVPAGAVVYRIAKVGRFDPAAFQSGKSQMRSELETQRRGQLLQSVVEGLRQAHKIEINEALLRQVSS